METSGDYSGQTKEIELTIREKQVIKKLREIPFGKVVIVMHDGQPQRLEEVKKNILLTD